MSAGWEYDDVMDVDDRPRCEGDTDDGGVCQTVLRADGTCPRHPVLDDEDYVYAMMRGRADPAGLAETVDPRIIDLGHDVLVKFTVREDGGPPVGLIESHPRPDDGRACSGSITFDVPDAADLRGPKWRVVSLDPLHIEPSVLCGSPNMPGSGCGRHGWIRDGRWVPA